MEGFCSGVPSPLHGGCPSNKQENMGAPISRSCLNLNQAKMSGHDDGSPVVLITGGGSGIGEAIAKTFVVERGFRVAIAGRTREKLDRVTQAVRRLADGKQGSGQCWPLQLDVRQADDAAACVREVVQRWGRVDILVNNAGLALGSPKPFHQQTIADIDTVLNTNINGVLYITHAVLQQSMVGEQRHGKTRGRGTIVNISSITGLDAPPMGEATYHTSKAALEGFSNVLRQELTGTNIRVCVVRPGFVGGSTNFHAHRLKDDRQSSTDAQEVFQGLEPLLQDDIASAVDYLVHLPERVSIRAIDVVPTAQRALVNNDRTWNERNGIE